LRLERKFLIHDSSTFLSSVDFCNALHAYRTLSLPLQTDLPKLFSSLRTNLTHPTLMLNTSRSFPYSTTAIPLFSSPSFRVFHFLPSISSSSFSSGFRACLGFPFYVIYFTLRLRPPRDSISLLVYIVSVSYSALRSEWGRSCITSRGQDICMLLCISCLFGSVNRNASPCTIKTTAV